MGTRGNAKKVPNIKYFSGNTFFKLWIFATILVLGLALALWLPFFGNLPSGLNRDEVALGYNAYSLLKTGKDEWGKTWPASFASFGDQKLPGYIYTLIPFISIFGLKIWVVRLPSLLAGIVVIVGTGFLALQIGKKLKLTKNYQFLLSLLTMIFLAVNPWQMHFSRVAYETHLAMAFFISGLTGLIVAMDIKSGLKQRGLIISSGLLFSLSMLTYHSYQIFIPLFIVALIILFKKKVFNLDKLGIIIAFFVGLLSIVILLSGGIIQANKIKSIGTSPFSSQNLLLSAVELREVSNFPLAINKLLFNRLTEGIVKFTQNYVSTFSGTFFFVNGSGHGDHNPGNGNNVSLFTAPLILLGFLFLWVKRSNQNAQLIIVWLLLGLIPSSLTTRPLLEVRIATIFPVLELLSALGIVYTFSILNKKWRIFFALVFSIITILSTIRVYNFYTKIAPRKAVDNMPYHQLANLITKYRINTDMLITQSPSSSPYIWYLFEAKIDPIVAQKQLLHYEITEEGFVHVKQFENIIFETINWG
jgi:4-amino-4-deoxy-L-arabinose transferase-like glycosyltransferase